MKKQKLNWGAAFNQISKKQQRFLMTNFMSAIEQVAFLSHLKPFAYEIKGKKIIIDSKASSELYFSSRVHTRSIYKILFEMHLRELLLDPKTRKFLSMQIKDVNMPVRIRHLVANKGCESMLDVAHLASSGSFYARGMGDKSILYLVNLFKQNGCGKLFI